MKSEGTRTALINHAPALINQIDPVRPASISPFCGVIETIDQGGKFDPKLTHTHARHLFALPDAFWTGKHDLLPHIALHLPNVARVRFEDVDGVKLNLLPVVVVELVERGNLPPKWRSGVAAEDQHHGPVVTK